MIGMLLLRRSSGGADPRIVEDGTIDRWAQGSDVWAEGSTEWSVPSLTLTTETGIALTTETGDALTV